MCLCTASVLGVIIDLYSFALQGEWVCLDYLCSINSMDIFLPIRTDLSKCYVQLRLYFLGSGAEWHTAEY